jgi:CRP-like cAMP-binding protein
VLESVKASNLQFNFMKLRSAENDVIVDALSKSPFWADLSKQDLKSIAKASRERKYAGGDTIVKKGEPGVGFYLILDGAVEIKSEGTTLAKLGPGQFFGEMSLLDNQPRSADVIATMPSRCLVVSCWSFKGVISENPRIALKMLQEMARRLRNTDKSFDKPSS